MGSEMCIRDSGKTVAQISSTQDAENATAFQDQKARLQVVHRDR